MEQFTGQLQPQIGMDEVIEHFYLMVQMTMCKQHTVLQFQLPTFHILFGQSRPRILRFMGAQLLFEIMEEGLTFINSPIIHGPIGLEKVDGSQLEINL